jgi:ribosomal protein S18 acetylase RimI-like enzyme
MNEPVRLRESTGADEDFLRDLFAATRPAPMNEPAFRALADLQFDARNRAYSERSADRPLIVKVGGQPAGVLWMWRSAGEYRIADLAVAPEFQRRNIARAALSWAIAEAERARAPLRLSVDRNNARAVRLYESAGFALTGSTDTDFVFELRPGARP